MQKLLETNCYGPLRLCQAFHPSLQKCRPGRIVNISSGAGALSRTGTGLAAYRFSKACLNALTVQLAADLTGDSVVVNAMCPGSLQTRMGNKENGRSPDDGADTAVWLALDAPANLSGKFIRDRLVIEW